MTAYVQAHIYSKPGATADGQVTVVIASASYSSTANAVQSFTDLLAYWSADLSTQSGETVLLVYSEATDRVTVSCSTTFDFYMDGNVKALLGFATDQDLAGTSYTAEAGPGGIVPITGAEPEPVRVIDRAELTRYRHGQAVATTWTQIRVQTVDLIARGESCARLTAWATSGFITVTEGATVLAQGFVVDETDMKTMGQREQFLVRRLVLVVADAATVEAGAYTGIWGGLAFGWSTIYALQVDGIPVQFVERLQGGLTGDGSLSIDDSADVGVEIDRERGIGAGLALSVVLRDTATVRGYMRSPSLIARLTASYQSDAPTCNVDDTTSWPASGTFFLGHETFTYTGKTGTTFTGCNRTSASVQRIYESAAGYVCTDRPYQWRGRRCLLSAYPVDPYGFADTTPIEVFRGEIEAEPLRQRDGFALTAQSLDRVLEREIVGVSTGVVESQDGCVAYPDLKLRMTVEGISTAAPFATTTFSYTFEVSPFTGLVGPTVIDWSLFAQQFRTAWNATVSAIVGNIYIDANPTLEPMGYTGLGFRLPLLYDAAFDCYSYSASWSGGSFNSVSGPTPFENMPAAFGKTNAFTTNIIVVWRDADLRQATVIGTPTWPAPVYQQPAPCAFVRLDDPTFTNATECRFIFGEKQSQKMVCESVLAPDGRLFLYGIRPKFQGVIKSNLVGATVVIGAALANYTLPELAYTVMVSTGIAGGGGNYDTLSQSQGYGIHPDQLVWTAGHDPGAGDPGTLDGLGDDAITALSALPERINLADFLGGLLALRRQAIALVPYDDRMVFRLVSTGPGGSDWVGTVDDDDLIGYAEEPAKTTERLRPPNRVTLEAGDDIEPVTVQDLSSVAIEGPSEWTLRVPVGDRDSLVALSLAYGQSLLSVDRMGQAATVRLPPWLPCVVGDSLALDVTHPGLWSPTAGTPGYTGNARISGLLRNLRTGVQTATLLLDGNQVAAALSPAWQVGDWTGPDNDPATIDIYQPADKENLFVQVLEYIQNMLAGSGGPVTLLHYEPGVSEGGGGSLVISAAALPGAAVRLTVDSSTATLTANSWLTFPDLASGDGSTWQDGHAHVDDGTYWEG